MDDTKTYSFAETLIAPEHIICSVQLRPFSLGHWIVLENYSSPLLSDQLYPDDISNDSTENYNHCLRHILLFIFVCSHNYEDNLRLIDDKEFYEISREAFEKHICEYIKHTKGWNIFHEINKIKEYLNYYINSMPHFVERGTPSQPSGIDWKSNLYAILKNEYGYLQNEIMDMSMRRIYSEWVSFAVKNGAIEVKTKQQLEAEEKARQLVDDIRAGKIKLTDKGELIICQ